ncbi:MAG: VWA domain-containing protein [Alphaproteobacteria bacterium]|jgi:Ca-activated chloride channel family protein|nr:VWA domain-containing protein [Alphaproteobacteria bacterium]MBP9777187.1 VWA domain-containing protein [Alphaproteobacteria bacterium]
MFMFYWPWLILLLPLPLLARLFLPVNRKTNANLMPTIRFPALHRLQVAFLASPRDHQPSGRWFLTILSLLWLSLLLAVMRPQFVDQFTDVQNQGYDLMMVVDISGSMEALDFSTKRKTISRLDVTKNVVEKFVRERQGDRVGLIVFGEQAFLHVPLTLDTLSVSHMLNNVLPGMAGSGTAIGDAIGLAVHNLRNRPEGSRVIVLLTDGKDTASSISPLKVADLAKDYNIRIYAIGVGNDGPVPYPNGRGGIVMAEIPLDEELLKKIAGLTNGKYFHASSEQALQEIYFKINSLEKTESNIRTYLICQPLYHYPLTIAAALLLILCFMPLYRRFAYGA